MRRSELRAWLKEHKQELVSELLSGTYEPDSVRRVEIPKPGGEVRQLGIPTVRDRLVQQAIHQVLGSVLDLTFSERSYGFRPGRSAEDALTQAQADIGEGYYVAVDIDVSKFLRRCSIAKPGEPRPPHGAACPLCGGQAPASHLGPLHKNRA